MRRAILAALLAGAAPVAAQDHVSVALDGMPGLLDLPSAVVPDDGAIFATYARAGDEGRATLSFQVAPRVAAAWRFERLAGGGPGGEDASDTSLDLRFTLLTEEGRRPSLAVGFQDVLGSGPRAGEYLVATKTFGDSVRLTGGLGWGRFAGVTRSEREDGALRFDEMFQGDVAAFAGIEWAPRENLFVKLEYSEDFGPLDAAGQPTREGDTPVNVGAAWRPVSGVEVQAAYLSGSTFALSATIAVNPNRRGLTMGQEGVPRPVSVRAARSWAEPPEGLTERLRTALAAEGLTLRALSIEGSTARIRYDNSRWRAEAQAMGRLARVLTAELPPGVETFVLEPLRAGIPVAAATFSRSDLETYETVVGGTDTVRARMGLGDAGSSAGLTPVPSDAPRFDWSWGPTFSMAQGADGFEPRLGAELRASYTIQPNLILSGSVQQRIYPRPDEDATEVAPGDLPVVRRNGFLYGNDGLPVIGTLTLAHYGRPASNLYSRVTAGLLESQYGGVSGEVLWKPVTSPWGLGAEVNWVRQRDFDQLLSFRDYETVTGHASLYYDLGEGAHAQLDAGRYLAGDWGATLSLAREFQNGWRVGAWVTATEATADEPGVANYGRGIEVSIPTDFIFGKPSRSGYNLAFGSETRDSGARLGVAGRLYGTVRDAHESGLDDGFGRFWR